MIKFARSENHVILQGNAVSMQLLLQPVNWTALTLQSTVTDKARESWQQQLDLEAANLYFLTSVQRLIA